MKQTVDARGYVCPMPVFLTQKAVQTGAPEILEVLVDDKCAVENISRFAHHQGYSISVQPMEDAAFCLTLEKQA